MDVFTEYINQLDSFLSSVKPIFVSRSLGVGLAASNEGSSQIWLVR